MRKLILFLSGIALTYACSDSTPLVGDYSLIRIETYDSSSNQWVESDWMRGGSGKLSYYQDSTMQVEFLPKEYVVDSIGRYAYTAEYIYDQSSGTIEHTRLYHTDVSEIGKRVTRHLTFYQDTLQMAAPEFGLRLKWLRVR